jgi:hypothetical protein
MKIAAVVVIVSNTKTKKRDKLWNFCWPKSEGSLPRKDWDQESLEAEIETGLLEVEVTDLEVNPKEKWIVAEQ